MAFDTSGTNQGTGATVVVTLTPSASANLYVFCVEYDGTFTSVGDSFNGTGYVEIGSIQTAGGRSTRWFYFENAGGGGSSLNFTFTKNNGSFATIWIATFTGIATSSALDQQDSNGVAGATNQITTDSITTGAGENKDILAFLSESSAGTGAYTDGTSGVYTIRSAYANGAVNWTGTMSSRENVAPSTATTCTVNRTGAQDRHAKIASFNRAAAGGGATSIVRHMLMMH